MSYIFSYSLKLPVLVWLWADLKLSFRAPWASSEEDSSSLLSSTGLICDILKRLVSLDRPSKADTEDLLRLEILLLSLLRPPGKCDEYSVMFYLEMAIL